MPLEQVENVVRETETGYSPDAISRPADKMKVPESSEKRRSTAGPTGFDYVRSAESVNVRIESNKKPVSKESSTNYREYRRICDELAAELRHAGGFIVDGEMSDEGLEIVVEVEAMLDRLYS